MKENTVVGKLGRLKKDIKYMKAGTPYGNEYLTKSFVIYATEINIMGELCYVAYYDSAYCEWRIFADEVEIIPDEEVQSILLKADWGFINKYIKLNEVI